MKRFFLLSVLFCVGCASEPPEVKRLSPVIASSKIPQQCQIVSVLKDSPAEKAGLVVGDIIKSVNGQVPADAAVLSDIVSAASVDSDFEILKKDGSAPHVKIHLNAGRPRLGSVCDLAGWEKPGMTAAGNESVTVFEGPFALTASGIIDKGIIFMRVRLSNNLDKPIDVSPQIFSVVEGTGTTLAVLSPKEVMCLLYGDKGAHLLALKKKHKETLDAQSSLPGMEGADEDKCVTGPKGRLSGSDPQFAEANAQYLATESLWPATYQPGSVADGLIYLKEPSSLPVTLKASLEGQTLVAQLGKPQASTKEMTLSQLRRFFDAQAKGTALRLTLKRGKVFVGKLSSYDENEERAWFNAPTGGMLRSTSFSLETIRYAEPLEQAPAKPTPTSTDLN